MNDLIAQLHDLLPDVPDARLATVIDVIARHLGRHGGRRSGVPFTGLQVNETESLTNAQGGSATLLGSDSVIRSGSSGPSKQSDLGDRQSDEPALLTFATAGKTKTWAFREHHRALLEQAYPQLDVIAEVRKAWVWVETSPGNKKTAAGMNKFLFGWLGRALNRGTAALKQQANGRSSGQKPSGLCEFHIPARTMSKAAPRHDEACSECRFVRAKGSPRPNGEPTALGDMK